MGVGLYAMADTGIFIPITECYGGHRDLYPDYRM